MKIQKARRLTFNVKTLVTFEAKNIINHSGNAANFSDPTSTVIPTSSIIFSGQKKS